MCIKPTTTTVKKSDGWDDWDAKPAQSTPVKKSSGWDDWDEKPSKPTTTVKKSDGWDDWDAKPVQSTSVKKNDGWDDWDAKLKTQIHLLLFSVVKMVKIHSQVCSQSLTSQARKMQHNEKAEVHQPLTAPEGQKGQTRN